MHISPDGAKTDTLSHGGPKTPGTTPPDLHLSVFPGSEKAHPLVGQWSLSVWPDAIN